MTKSILVILLFIFCLTDGYSQLSKTKYEDIVEYFVNCIKDSDIDKLDLIISYPFERPYPIPSISNKKELKSRYAELFDDSLISVISNSNIKNDWTDMGWRGIMLNNGIVWLDYDGKLMTTNYTSKKEKAIEEKLIELERSLLFDGLKDFEKPIHTIETNTYIIRVDLLENQKFRYASWSKKSDISNKPDLVLNNGEWTPDGSGGNHHFTFTNGVYSYIVYVNVLKTAEMSPFNLEVMKNDKVILEQSAELKKI